ncbi:hypothetical protein BCR41DRAFT_391308 [Lobosporangium transversale]|uniref:FAR-17a/AIG1-like protein-domain-containing protein n=1 Tax=Lobosporangium transversale TaxID=64571 RepID=A0A1Y2H2U7_9FUNG|nr:hypothetical protein BCR41DRAFT_391308 [Lobosporangium transversale]ORZ28890.1 hypothetical protein BCR41DRAFT_391308 [Lobosporangium transversale]|eukprot:XP_021886563.1 hypothetical protein BCR41DRAFT_391308 [Lobosporangium transversale]
MKLPSFFRLTTLGVERSVTSYLSGPKVLMWTRAVGVLYLTAVLIGALATTPSLHYFISFFTNISFCALLIYYIWSLIRSIQYCRLPQENKENWTKQRSQIGEHIYWILYGTLTVFHILVPLVYWSVLRAHQKPHTGVYEWATISEHSADGIFMILEIIFTQMNLDIRHLVWALFFMLLFLLSAFVNYWTKNWWVYSFLDYNKHGWKIVGLFYVGTAVAIILLYVLVWGVHYYKEHLASRSKGAQARMRHGASDGDHGSSYSENTSVSSVSASTGAGIGTCMNNEKASIDVTLQSVKVEK